MPRAYQYQQQSEYRPAVVPQQSGVLAAADRLDYDEVWVPYRWPGQLGGKEVYLSGERICSTLCCSSSKSSDTKTNKATGNRQVEDIHAQYCFVS